MAKSDIEIAREATLKPISEIADKLGIPSNALLPFGHDKGKITADYIKSLVGQTRRQTHPGHGDFSNTGG